jgi:hypothetical protein
LKARDSFWLAVTALTGAASAAAYFLWVQNFIAIDRCMDAGGAYDMAWQVCDKSNAESISTQFTGPVYVGTIDGQSVRLKLRDDALGYRMIAPPLRILGDLNTLRGFERDDNAVVYVLNASGEEARQIRLLLTKTGTRDELVRIGPDDKLHTKEVLRATLGKS